LIPESKRTSWRFHAVAAGDTLESVAAEYRISAAELAGANQLTPGGGIAGTEGLVIPLAPVAAPAFQTRIYVVRRGDTLVTIADRFGVSLSELRRWNGIASGTRVEPKRRLRVAEPAPLTHVTTGRHLTAASSDETPKPASHAKTGTPTARDARTGVASAATGKTTRNSPTAASRHTHPGASKTKSGAGSMKTHQSASAAKASSQ
jgi:membrane-bound lytic murein transglycosylase D